MNWATNLRFCLIAFLATALLSPLVSAASFAQEKTVAKRPNIVLIMADDLGYGDLGCYGQARIQTPNLDRMAKQGLRFTDFYAGSTVCAPSRCTLMTGYHSGHSWIRGNGELPLRPTDVTMAQVLQKSGYKTGLFGKWGLGAEGTAQMAADLDSAGYSAERVLKFSEQVMNDAQRDLWLDAEEALEYGIIDEIVKTKKKGK